MRDVNEKEGVNMEDLTKCAECGGDCCKRMPGCCDVSDNWESMLLSGKYCIDWWEGDVFDGDRDCSYFIRPCTSGDEGKLLDPSWGGRCTFLTSTGCSLEHDQRPKECRDLDPNKGCISEWGKEESAKAWYEILTEEVVNNLS